MMENKLQLDQKRMGRLVFGCLGFLLAAGYLIAALNMPQGSPAAPGPGIFPAGVGIAAVVVTLIVIVEALMFSEVSESLELPQGRQRRLLVQFVGSLVAFVVLLPFLGQYLASSLYVLAVLRTLSTLGWVRSGVYSVLIGGGLSWTFMELLSIRLPGGIW
ncbi:hypothetical protein AU252_01105 [Pseudarthrobacter sulfonivorans]|uniref:DUF1468 domain-containing protein n=1 Tax=Pseudarthrobacter sulfonivorans TaxID=121292 RepID=A0A0U3QSR6_9MICC|nr:tripartite tricarboxylate transporter TctB family protein [Pseudarthrobacter sulfonivorans]ALV39932.1 hypothetical protein AU252_01105 [Pseudarthrobacter sulfonivorans]